MAKKSSIRDITTNVSDKVYSSGSVNGNAVNMFSGSIASRSDTTSLVNEAYKTIDTLAMWAREKTDSLFDVLAETTIDGFCDFNTKNYQLMKRLMSLNINEKDITLNSLGTDAMFLGDSTQITGNASNYTYTQGNNYVYEYAKSITETKGCETTKAIGTPAANNAVKSYTNHNELYQSTVDLYPDDNDTGSGQFYESQKWSLGDSKESLLRKTKELFQKKKINTIISRFHTETTSPEGNNAKKSPYGMSHGRNLLTKEAEKSGGTETYPTNGYDNPYCRVWTHHYQYNQYKKLIRPFKHYDDSVLTTEKFHDWDNFDNPEAVKRTVLPNKDGSKTVTTKMEATTYGWKCHNPGWKYSVLNTNTNRGSNGLPNITPKYLGGGANNIHTRDCMFSIENLAWKGFDPYSFEEALSWEQRGPNGGRIMWFPPYGISFNETTSTNWKNHTFIGRGEDVYTYTNTVRQGTLNFMLVVDHPSIIDYVSWNEDNRDKVSDTDILRFFAGCDVDTLRKYAMPTPLTDEYIDNTLSVDATEEKKEEKLPEPEPEADSDKEYNLDFYVFYPNNYSGVYDKPGETVEAMAYLLAGTGAQKQTSNDSSTPTADLPITFEGLGSAGNGIGVGYEMATGLGITVDSTDKDENLIKGTDKTWKQINSITPKRTKYVVDTKSNPKKWWYYRIDGKYDATVDNSQVNVNTYDQKLLKGSNYKDSANYKLNSNVDTVKSFFNDESEHLFSFAEIAYAMCENESAKEVIRTKGDVAIDSDRCKELLEILSKDSGYKITGMSGIGYSNQHGSNANKQTNNSRNDNLARQRVNSVFTWLDTQIKLKGLQIEGDKTPQEITIKDSKGSQNVSDEDKNNASGKTAKQWRSARITIHLKKTATTTVSETQQTETQEDGTVVQESSTFVGYTLINKDEGLYQDTNGKKWVYNTDTKQMELYFEKENGSEYGSYSVKNGYNTNTKYSYRTAKKDTEDNSSSSDNISGDRNKIRYDQEYYFFKKLEQDDKVIFDKLMDKIQYFDPAFHSMTPEGFNARLTFLQQCMRQGNTVGASDYDAKSANNLAFGRAPYCVLRLGDFYHQMIVIDNISFDYQPLVWDLNSEGAGMQPMICNVSMSFKFIGGGDMGGAIRRLQNAMSFNYYANSSLYDNRADRVDNNGWDEHTAQNAETKYTFYNTKMKD